MWILYSWKTYSRLIKEVDGVVCLPGARIEHVTERVQHITGRGTEGSILVHIMTNNADKEGTTSIVEKYRNRLKKTKQARVGQIILSGSLPVFGNRIQGYRKSKQMSPRDGGAALQGIRIGIREFVTALWGKKTCA